MKSLSSIEISLNSVKKGLCLWIDARKPNSLFDAIKDAEENQEARFQLVEGCFYDFQISDPGYVLGGIGENIVQQHKRNPSLGTIAPNIFVGTLSIPLLEKATDKECCRIELEVQSVKSGYRDDYRDMLELITEKCTDLLLQADSPVSQYFEIDYTRDSQALYQRFAFIRSIIGNDEFAEAIHRVVTAPVTKWQETTEVKDVRNNRRFTNANIKEILKSSRRTKLPDEHYLRDYNIDTLPERIVTLRKADSADTPENRFVKHALETFLNFCSGINSKAKEFGHRKMENESELLIRELEAYLHHSIFKDVSRPATLTLNSPVLQRKEGYREILRIWLMYDLAAKLVWRGGDDIYSGGKKDVAALYEYWLFFQLLDLFQSVFEIIPKHISELIQETRDGLNLQVKQGRHIALEGVYKSGSRQLNVRFSYNRSFRGSKNYPGSGSWTTTLRPDYTLSFWPCNIQEEEAEKQELAVHIHFDAKYKIANLADFMKRSTDGDLDQEKIENRKGIYKNADLLKMHAYKDAIRRTGGAYVLYPGDKAINQRGFHEIIPGLGAFPVKPSKTESGINELKAFILEVLDHFQNRASQRERIGYRTYDIFKEPPESDDVVKEPLPETYDKNRGLIPDETFVLVGFYKSREQYEWIQGTGLYNFRMGSDAGSLILDKEKVGAEYLLLHTFGDKNSGDLWKIVSKGPKVYSKNDLAKKGYPSPEHDYYLVIEVEPVSDEEFKDVQWDFKALKNYSPRRASAIPFSASLTELVKNKI